MVFLLFMKATMSSQLCDELFSPREVIGKTVPSNLTEISVKWRLVKFASEKIIHEALTWSLKGYKNKVDTKIVTKK